jgi:hypothetical protein
MTAGEPAGRHLVAVHGVGVHRPGALVETLAADLSAPGEIGHRRDAYLAGRRYPSIEIGDARLGGPLVRPRGGAATGRAAALLRDPARERDGAARRRRMA